MNSKRAEKFREEVSYFRVDDATYAPEKNPGILMVTTPEGKKDSGERKDDTRAQGT